MWSPSTRSSGAPPSPRSKRRKTCKMPKVDRDDGELDPDRIVMQGAAKPSGPKGPQAIGGDSDRCGQGQGRLEERGGVVPKRRSCSSESSPKTLSFGRSLAGGHKGAPKLVTAKNQVEMGTWVATPGNGPQDEPEATKASSMTTGLA